MYTMNNGAELPNPGYGTWKAHDADAFNGLRAALKAGYTHIDTAACYRNEPEVGIVLADADVDRDKLFITTKCWNDHRGREAVKEALEESLKKLQLDSVDLYLLHWPANPAQYENWDEVNQSSWQGMIDLYKEGKAKAIGVSNFTPKYLASLMKMEVAPMVNQIEFHPGWTQPETVAYCKANNIVLEAWSPLGHGEVLNDPLIVSLAEKYDRTPAQICLRYVDQKGLVPLVKSVHEDRIVSNLAFKDFILADEDVAAIDALPVTGWSGHNPDDIDF